MDAVLTAALGAVPQLGGVAAFVLVALILIRREQQASERYSAELDRVNAAHDAELAELRAENTRLRQQRDDAEAQVDLEREARRQAQDATGPHPLPG